MIPIRFLSDDDVKSILDIRNTVACVERAYVLKAKQRARLFPSISEDLIHGIADMDIKSGLLDEDDLYGLKLVSWFGSNERIGLPALTGLVMVFDLKNGFPKAIINARYLTAMRTGAAGAVGVKHLANPDSDVLLVVGTGFQAVFQIAATLSEVPTIRKVYAFNPLRYDSAEKFLSSIRSELEKIPEDQYTSSKEHWKHRIAAVQFIPVENPLKVLEEADAVITVTPSRKPLIFKEWIRPGTHFSCIGADMPGKQELDVKIFDGAVVFTDDAQQSLTVGEVQCAVKAGLIHEENKPTEIGHLILGDVKGRKKDTDITIFDSTGIALQDLAVSRFLVSKAEELNLGRVIHL
ncbi:MAG: ornithine cyclodeaminase family protein [Clostridia bacterium]|nr:ornithine cyclodeaminase family protein [Clostridia bacterium]